jgi:phosphatidylinositol alpha-1,6-mannosyltransferase
VLYYGVDLTRFSPVVRAQHLRKHYGIGPDDTVAVFVGRMVDEMGLATLLSAIPAVIRAKPSFRFVVAGRKGDLTNEALQLRAAFPDRLVVIPDASDDELPFLYAAASMVVVPSRDDRACLGLAAAEGMASGKPVIITSAGGGSEVVVDRETGLVVPPADVAALTNALLELAGDPERARKMGLRGRQRAEVMFDKDATNRAMERILLEVAV